MKTAKIAFQMDRSVEFDIAIDSIYHLLGVLVKNGQVADGNYPMVRTKQGVEVYVNIPETNALAKINDNVYVNSSKKKLKELNISIKKTILGEEPESWALCSCTKTRSFILFIHYLSINSPLKCFECFGVTPLYKIPKTNDDEYSDVIAWQSDYKSCDSMQMNGEAGERFGEDQLSKFHSGLSQQGISICKKIEKLTGKPVYYYLYKYKAMSLIKEKERLCPSCGGKWLLSKSLHKLFDFKCDNCRLVSNIGFAVRYSPHEN